MANDPLYAARETFLSMIADARVWKENVDGDIQDGRPIMSIDCDLNVDDFSLRQVVEALGIPIAFDQTAFQAINAALEIPPEKDQ